MPASAADAVFVAEAAKGAAFPAAKEAADIVNERN